MKLCQNVLALAMVLLCSCMYAGVTFGQKTDTAAKGVRPKNNNIFQFAINAVTRSHADSASIAVVLNTKSELPFIPYQGKVIRHIYVKQYGFERAFTDTSRVLDRNKGARLLNSLHHNTRDWVIRNNLFIGENTPLNAYKLADNERYLRSLEFIQDARILVSQAEEAPDSVDLFVITKDLFSISGELNDVGTHNYKGNISDANALGMGQKIQFTSSLETNRKPGFGYGVLYTKNNIANSFINLTLYYTNINNDLNSGAQDEHAKYITLQRPLYSQYSHLAGAVTLGNFEAFNTYRIPDSLFYKYEYSVHDAWIGYNLGIQHTGLTSARDRRFISMRYLKNHFIQTPYQVGNKYIFKFNDREALLGQFTFFKQDFYKTNYIYGFGTTEDVPYGYNIAITGGWYRQLHLSRPYAGVNANWYVATGKQDFIQYFIRSGAFLGNGSLQDASVLVGTSLFSRLFIYDGLKIRQFLNLSYTKQFNRVGIDPLRIDNIFGIRYFSSDSVLGNQRISLHTETSFFTRYKLLGFKFAPFSFADFSLITPEQEPFSKSALFYSLGGGVRTRNENFVFGTIELRIAYFPRKANQNESFKITTNIDLQFKYNNNYVQAPDIVQLNTDNNQVFSQ